MTRFICIGTVSETDGRSITYLKGGDRAVRADQKDGALIYEC